MLRWFIVEQGEEETSAQELIDKFELIGGAGSAIYLLDKELGRRED